MITNSNNNSRNTSKDQDFLKEEDLKKKDSQKESEVKSKEEEVQDQESLEEPETRSLGEGAETVQDVENIDEADDEIKAALVAGSNVDEDIKAKVEKSPSPEPEEEQSQPQEDHKTSSEEVVVESSDSNEEVDTISTSKEEDANASEEDEMVPSEEDEVVPSDEKSETTSSFKDSQGQDVQMEEMISVDEMDDIGQTEDEYSKDEEEKEGDKEDEAVDYASYSKEQLVKAAESLLKEDNIRKADNDLKEIKSFVDEIKNGERKHALEKFIEEGGSEDDFDYKGDELDTQFEGILRSLKEKKDKYLIEMEKNREQNLSAKNSVLEKLRRLVDSEETNTSITALKEIQNEWRSIGPVPSQFVRSLWANYSALIDRFYDNRSIYFELKELDRKKNLEAKIDICERAEKLEKVENLKDAIKELNDLHEEFKHVGPAPREEQETIWKRFKTASDKVYSKRKEFVENLKTNLKQNYDEKLRLGEEVQSFIDFDSDKINEWNAKTKEILDLQKKWEAIGGLPREHARDINKQFWSAFKKFFNNKSLFFKRLEGQRDENLRLKEELVKRAENLKESDNWEKTANELKELQKEWKNIGPVPEKIRNEVYMRFKKACDDFFERKRSSEKEAEKDYFDNLRQKETICGEIEKMAEEKSSNIEKVEEMMDEYNEIGFVPRNSIKTIQKRFIKAVEKFANNAPDLSGEDKKDILLAAQYQKLRSSPNANRRLQRKENTIKRQIGELENDISLWKNNVEFFANSASADKLRAEFNDKIARAKKELKELKQQLKVIRTI